MHVCVVFEKTGGASCFYLPCKPKIFSVFVAMLKIVGEVTSEGL